MEIDDVGELEDDDDSYLPFNLKVLDARELFNNGYKVFIKFNYTKDHYGYWVCTRTRSMYETFWSYKFKISLEEAREIVELGYGNWYAVREHLR